MFEVPVILPFRRLLAVLQAHDFSFGIDTLERLNRYWLFSQKQGDLSREQVKYHLASLLCRREEEQLLFGEIFEANYPYLEPFDLAITESDRTKEEGKEETAQPPVQPIAIKPKEPPIATPAPKPPKPFTTKGPILPRLAFPGNPLKVWNLPQMGPALFPLQEKVWMETTEWDIPSTIRHTIRAGGIPRLSFRRRRRAPRYLALIEQQSPRDHMAAFAAELLLEINRRDLETDFFFFKNSPARCWKDLPDRRSHVYLEFLKSEWEGARLLLVGEASCFIDPATGVASNLVLDILDHWDEVALLCTNSPLEWGDAEQTLSGLFPVVPLSVQGLGLLMALWNGVSTKNPLQWQLEQAEAMPPSLQTIGERTANDLVVELFRYLGKPAFRWVCATCVYPEIYYELTAHLHDEAIPPLVDYSEWEQNQVWHEALRTISRLEWYRLGYIPERMRENLRQRLSATDLAIVETEIKRILEWSYNAVPEDSYAYAERREIFAWLGDRLFRVLWLDDRPENHLDYQQPFTKEMGVVFRNARSTKEALDYLQKEAFDLVISDTGREGEENLAFSTMQEIRTLRPALPVVFFTTARGLNLRSSLLNLGALEVTNDIRTLRNILDRAVRRKFGLEEPAPAFSESEPVQEAVFETVAQAETPISETSQMLQDLAWSVCQISLRTGTIGTGFLTEGGYVYTAQTVLPDREAVRGASVSFIHPVNRSPQFFQLDEEDFFSDKEIDCARVRLREYVYDRFRLFGFLPVYAGMLGTGAKVSLVYFDPQARDFRFVPDCPVVQFDSISLRYEAETTPGSTGAPLFNDKGQVIGIHLARTERGNVKRGVMMGGVLERLERRTTGQESFFRNLKEQIAEGRTAAVLEELRSRFPDNNQVLMLAAQFRRNEQDRLRGTIADEEFRKEQFVILNSLLSLIDELEKHQGTAQPLTERGTGGRYASLKNLLAEDEIKQVLEVLVEEHPENADLVMLFANFNRNELNYLRGQIDLQAYRQEKYRILSALLNQMDVMETTDYGYAQTPNVAMPGQSGHQRQLRQLVINGQLNSVFDILLKDPYEPEALLRLQSKYRENERQLISGLISHENYRINLNQVNYALLEIIQNLEPPQDAYTQEAASPEQPTIDTSKIFISFDQADEVYLEQFLKHFAPLRRQEKLTVWTARDLPQGVAWQEAVLENLASAYFIVLLVSPAYLASDWIWENEFSIAMRRRQEGSALVIPVIVSPCDWHSTELKTLQVLPPEGQAVSTWKDENEAWVTVVNAIRELLAGSGAAVG